MTRIIKKSSQLVAGVFVVIALGFALPVAHADDAAPTPKPSSLDDELLKELDDALGGKSAEKPEHGHGHDHKATGESDATDAKKPEAAPQPADPSQRPKPSTDEELLKQLDAEDDSPAGGNKEQAGEDLGPDADPLTRIGTKMRQAVTLIDREKLSERTTLLQDEIVRDIDELIKKQKKKMQQQQQQQQQQASAKSQQQKQKQSDVKPQGKNAQERRQPRSGSGDQPASQRPEDSTDRLGKNQLQPPQLDPAAQEELLKRVWGALPEKDREQVRQAAGEEFLPDYETLIIRYFRRLAEEEGSQP